VERRLGSPSESISLTCARCGVGCGNCRRVYGSVRASLRLEGRGPCSRAATRLIHRIDPDEERNTGGSPRRNLRRSVKGPLRKQGGTQGPQQPLLWLASEPYESGDDGPEDCHGRSVWLLFWSLGAIEADVPHGRFHDGSQHFASGWAIAGLHRADLKTAKTFQDDESTASHGVDCDNGFRTSAGKCFRHDLRGGYARFRSGIPICNGRESSKGWHLPNDSPGTLLLAVEFL